MYPKEMEIYVHTKSRTQLFIEALFIIGSKGKNKNKKPGTKQMSFNQWIVKLGHIYTLEYNSAMKRNWILECLHESPGNYPEWKKAHLIKLHTVWFHSYTIFEMTKLWAWKTDVAAQGQWGREDRCGYKRATPGILVMELLCIFTVEVVTWIYPCDNTKQN